MYRYTTFEEEELRKQIKGRVLRILEFDKVIEMLTECARTAYGRRAAEALFPTTDKDRVGGMLGETDEVFCYINKYGQLPLGNFPAIDEHLDYAEAGGCLSMKQLLNIATFLRGAEELKGIVASEKSDMSETTLFRTLSTIDPMPRLHRDISTSIDNEDEMNDRASDELYQIRREKRSVQDNIRVLLNRVIRQKEDILQEAIITMRGDRYCVPVRAECRSSLPGIVHDTSSTGQTVFIEPMAVVEANNRIRELITLEKAEIERILKALTAQVISGKDQIRSIMAIVEYADLSSAKANLAIKMEAVRPALNSEGRIRMVKARHPLIDADKVVPVDIVNGYDYRSLIITGPNTGGKTVSLKTCGLLTLMTMAGLMIPCAVGSEVAVFDRVLADIGDEQSIEQSLSTFSAHMSGIVFILKNIKGKSLVLLDELGSGTDPAEGAALAVAILDALFEKGCTVMATTHYKELKAYAIGKEGVMNASFEFDTETLSPTYRMIIGTPGVSNAFVISEKLGLPKRIIADAKSRMSEEELSYEKLLAKAETDGKEAERLRAENEELNRALSGKMAELEEEKKALRSSKTKILNESRAEQRELLRAKEEELTEMIKAAGKKARRDNAADAAEELDRIRRRLRAGIKDLSSDEEDDKLGSVALPGEVPAVVRSGEEYYIPHLGVLGKVVSEPGRNGKLRISSGSMTYTVELSQLRKPTADNVKTDPPKSKKRERASYKADSSNAIRHEKTMTTMSELVLIGMKVAEAESALDSYIDDCQLSGIKTIRIVHGKGTGALRAAVDTILNGDPRVKDHRLGIKGEGDDGVTVATLY